MDIPVCDLHCDTAFKVFIGKKITDPSLEVNLGCMLQGNIGIQVFACYLSPNVPQHQRFNLTLDMIRTFKREVDQYGERIQICTRSSDIKAAIASKRTAAILAIENGMAIENNPDNLQRFYEEGVRCLTIVHSASSDWAISCNDASPAFDGLTAFGESVVRRLNRLGMIIDISHAHSQTAEKIMALSEQPVIASHSCAAALCDVSRNLTDNQIEAVAQSGGMIGINFFPGFLDFDYYRFFINHCGDLLTRFDQMEQQAGANLEQIAAAFASYRDQANQRMANNTLSSERIIDHIDYIRKLVGEQYVGFGSDFDGVPVMPRGMESCDGFNLLKHQLRQRRFSEDTIANICYRNFLRVFKTVCG